jgi:hypothetical protein
VSRKCIALGGYLILIKSCHLQWFKYADNESTWEVEGNLTSAKKHIKTFWADLNINKSDFDGHEVRASEENIGESFNISIFHTVKK